MGYGGYHPFPRRFGGGRPRLRVVHDALNAARGSALDADNSSTVVWVENMAYARAITFDGYGQNDRLALQWDPYRMTAFLSRWERIFKIRPAPDATDRERRDALVRAFQRVLDADAIHDRLVNALRQEVGDYFVDVEYISYANAVINVPDATYPWGTPNAAVPWSSTTAHYLILLEKPANASEGDFYAAAGKVAPIADRIIPAWCTFDWYRAPAAGPAVSVSGGPSRGGFYLDDEHNLDNNVFDV